MASAGFGRKVTAAAPDPDADLAARREAFLAAERARRASQSQSESVPSGGGFAAGATGYGKARSAQPAAAAVSGPFFVREKSLATAYLLWFFLGGFSAHRFYLGYTVSAGIQLFLRFGGAIAFVGSATTKSGGIGGLGLMMFAAGWLWMLIDGFLIPGMRRNANRTATTAPAYVFA
jgi:TM2 domain-containing membrane protein YozV